VDLEKGFPEAIQLTLDNWSYIQKVDYEQLSFKCKACHEYGHFAKNFLQNKSDQPEERVQEQWKQPKRKKVVGKEVAQQQDQIQGGIHLLHLLITLDHQLEGIVGLNQAKISMWL
jgi:hypothetical protein